MGHILIVDDQVGIRLLLNEIFKKEQYTTYIAANGIEALQFFEQNEIDCILLDIKMPGMDGIEVLKRIREVDLEIPVFMMTAYGEQDLMEVATNLNVHRFFTKPFNIFDVRDTVNQLLKG